MKAEIISIGDELLIGQTINTNVAWMAQELNKIGIDVYQTTVISDDKDHIITAINEAGNRVELVLITGGLGPTKDDITKTTLTEYFNTKLVEDQEILEGIKERLKARNLEMNELNRKQALVPENAMIFRNYWGTAPGMWFEDRGVVFVSLPGVPAEMKGLMTKYIIPAITDKFKPPVIIHETILTMGTIEARLAEILSEFEDSLPDVIKLAYLPSTPIIKLRLTAKGSDEKVLRELLDNQISKLYKVIPDLIFGKESETLEQIVGKMLRERGQTISTAESCTGGNISRLITSIPGSSDYYIGSIVSYADRIKTDTLNVNPDLIKEQGAVSKDVVIQMAKSVKEKFQTDYSIAVSGIAGPDGGSDEKPVGTTHIAIGTPGSVVSYKFTFGSERDINIHRASLTALNLLRKIILKDKGFRKKSSTKYG